jgi:hypothetical protein
MMRLWVKRTAAALAALVLAAAGAAAAQVPDPFARDLAQKLAGAEQLVGAEGYARAAGPFAGGLRQSERRAFTVMLRAGQDYRVIGVCNESCGDLDLRMYDAAGQIVTADTLADDVPILRVTPRATGNYAIEADMAQCAARTCWFAFNVYAR